jgi:hypothetical protein
MRPFSSFAIFLAALVLAGCKREDVKVYHVPQNDSTAPPEQIAATDQSLATPPHLQWTLPDGWQEIAPSQMRVASFTVTNAAGQTADVGVIPLPATGQEIQLVNMWREQMQLPALPNATTAVAVAIGGDSAKLFDIASDAPIIDGKFRARILVAMLARGETSWFFKMTGEDSFVVSQKQNFLQFLKSVSFGENAPAQIAAAPAAPGESGPSIWTVPTGWQAVDPGAMLLAKFLISSGEAKADVNISSFANDGGGLLANVNRWRGQLGLPQVSDTDLPALATAVDSPGGKIQIVDLSGTDAKTGKPARLVGAVVPQDGQTWFYKLMGDEAVVARQKDAFIQFIQSANYANARNAR